VDPAEQYVNPDPEIGAAPIDLSGWAEPIERWRRQPDEARQERRGFLASILQNVTLKDGIVTAEYRPAFRVLAQMSAEPTPPPNVRGGAPRSSKLTVWGPYGDAFRTVLRSTESGA
jgi:hypothetical protein